jgi:hypothetical protein
MDRADLPFPVVCPHCDMRQMQKLDRAALRVLLEHGNIVLLCKNDKCLTPSWIWTPEADQLRTLQSMLDGQ